MAGRLLAAARFAPRSSAWATSRGAPCGLLPPPPLQWSGAGASPASAAAAAIRWMATRVCSAAPARAAVTARSALAAATLPGALWRATASQAITAQRWRLRALPAGARWVSRSEAEFLAARKRRNTTVMYYVLSVFMLGVGLAYASVPLYRLFCQASGFAGTVKTDINPEKIAKMESVDERVIRIKFNADTGATMRWAFKPLQKEVYLVPGETSLAFYTATNPTDAPVIGISTYNVVPYEAGQYFNKIQCFCFEEQMLNPHEQVDLPVFFYIDPEFANDPLMSGVDEITLSYTFFQARDGESVIAANS